MHAAVCDKLLKEKSLEVCAVIYYRGIGSKRPYFVHTYAFLPQVYDSAHVLP